MIRILTLAALSIFLIQCEEKETDDVYAAQICLNDATADNVDTCVAKISGYNSPLSYRIRCGADFVRQNITGARIVSALEKLDNNTDNSKDPMAHMMAFVTFDTVANADAAISDCTASGSEGMVRIAYMSKMATAIVIGLSVPFQADGSVDPDALDAAIDAANSGSLTDDMKTSIGSTLQLAYPSYCGTGGAFKNEEICTNMNNSINAGDPKAIAEALIDQLKDDQ